MKQGIEFIKREVLNSLVKNSKIYIVVLIIFTILNLIKVNSCIEFGTNGAIDIFIYIYGGIPFTKYLSDLRLPLIWLSINLIIILIVTKYTKDNFKSGYIYTVIRSKNIVLFWISRLVVVFVNILVYYAIIFTSYIVIVYSTSKIHFNQMLINGEVYTMKYIIIIAACLYITTSLVLCFITITLSIQFDVKYVVIVAIILLVCTLFLDTFLIVGQGSLLLRHLPFYDTWISLDLSIIYNLICALLIGIGGVVLIYYKDII